MNHLIESQNDNMLKAFNMALIFRHTEHKNEKQYFVN